MMVFTLLAPVVIAPPVQAAGIPEIVDEMNKIIPYLDQGEKQAIGTARDTLQGIPLNDDGWNIVLGVDTANDLLTPQVIAKFEGADDAAKKAAAKEALINVAIGLGNIYYLQDASEFEGDLYNFKEANKATFQKLFGSETTVDDLYQLLQATRGQFATVIKADSNYFDNLAFGSNDNLVNTIPEVINAAMQNVLNNNPDFADFRGKLEAIGWNTTKLINQQKELGTIIDSTKAARLALAKAAVRSESELFYDDNGTRVLIPKDPDTKINVNLSKDDVVVYALKIMGQEAATTMVEWVSSDPTVASLAYGDGTTHIKDYPVVTANQAGTTTITAYRYDQTTFPEGTAANDWVLKYDVTVTSDQANGGIVGTIITPNSSSTTTGLAGVTVNLVGTSYSAVTDANGQYVISDVPEGNYTIKFTKDLYAPIESNISIASSLNTTFDSTIYLWGDVNGDSYVNVDDAAAIVTYFVKTTPLTIPSVADVNQDTYTNVDDVAAIITYFVKTTPLPVNQP